MFAAIAAWFALTSAWLAKSFVLMVVPSGNEMLLVSIWLIPFMLRSLGVMLAI